MFSCTIDKKQCTFPFFNLFCGVKHFSAVWNAGRFILAVKILSCVIRSDNKTEAGIHIRGKEIEQNNPRYNGIPIEPLPLHK